MYLKCLIECWSSLGFFLISSNSDKSSELSSLDRITEHWMEFHRWRIPTILRFLWKKKNSIWLRKDLRGNNRYFTQHKCFWTTIFRWKNEWDLFSIEGINSTPFEEEKNGIPMPGTIRRFAQRLQKSPEANWKRQLFEQI